MYDATGENVCFERGAEVVTKLLSPECKSPKVIRRSVPKGDRFNDLYCECSNKECGHTYVLNLTFSHTLSPSSMAADRLLKELVGQISS